MEEPGSRLMTWVWTSVSDDLITCPRQQRERCANRQQMLPFNMTSDPPPFSRPGGVGFYDHLDPVMSHVASKNEARALAGACETAARIVSLPGMSPQGRERRSRGYHRWFPLSRGPEVRGSTLASRCITLPCLQLNANRANISASLSQYNQSHDHHD